MAVHGKPCLDIATVIVTASVLEISWLDSADQQSYAQRVLHDSS
jgi:hypothetical protein